jgi:addiction module HigA family antidote
VIKGFADDATKDVYEGRVPKKLPADILSAARRKLRYLDSAETLNDLKCPPGNKLHPLVGDEGGAACHLDQWKIPTLLPVGQPGRLRGRDNRLSLNSNMKAKTLPNIHPGEILLEDFLKPAGISQYRLAKAIGIPESRISQIVNGARSVTADTALRFSKFFGTTPKVWLNLQNAFDLEEAEKAKHKEFEQIRPHEIAAA